MDAYILKRVLLSPLHAQMNKKIQYYKTLSDDVIDSGKPDYKLPDDYCFIRNDFPHRLRSAIVYGLVCAIGFVYCKLVLRVSIKNRKILRGYKQSGYFVYANHTQPFGDVVLPAFLSLRKRVYTIVSPANMSLPFIGKILPALGAIPIPNGIRQMKQFLDAVKERVRQGHCVVIYPEAHVWPYYTEIRPFPITSFRFPVETQSPVFAMTTTYRKSRWCKRPKTTVYLDGPFIPDDGLSKKEQQHQLHQLVFDAFKKRCECSTYEYIGYQKKEESQS